MTILPSRRSKIIKRKQINPSRYEKALDRIPLIFIVFTIAIGAVFGILALAGELDVATRYLLYGPYAVAASIVAYCKYYLLRRGDEDGKVSVLLVTMTYVALCFAFTVFGIFLLVLIQSLGLSITEAADGEYLRSASYFLLGAGMGGHVIAATIFLWCLKYNCLGRRIYPFPWRQRKDK